MRRWKASTRATKSSDSPSVSVRTAGRLRRWSVRPTGTTATACTFGREAKYSRVASSASPSLRPGTATTCVNRSIGSSRSIMPRTLVARGSFTLSRHHFIMSARSASSAVCTLTYSGDRCSSRIRCTSSSVRFVRVTKLP